MILSSSTTSLGNLLQCSVTRKFCYVQMEFPVFQFVPIALSFFNWIPLRRQGERSLKAILSTMIYLARLALLFFQNHAC